MSYMLGTMQIVCEIYKLRLRLGSFPLDLGKWDLQGLREQAYGEGRKY